jgi:predicted membrane GTPase involved in stress response
MTFPIRKLIRDPNVESQESASRAMVLMVSPSDRHTGGVTKDGLLLRAVSELDLEIASDRLRAVFRYLVLGKPQINYIEADTWQEPYASLTARNPSECLAEVLADLRARRAEIQGSESSAPGEAIIRAAAPMVELFGYSTTLRSLTRGRGTHEQAYLDYRPFPHA